MEKAKVKKEIIVKRLSAFKFEVEVSSEELQQQSRASVIQKAPPAKTTSSTAVPNPYIEPIRHAVSYRIMEMLLFKLLGEHRLKTYCGYPASSPCALLKRVVFFSSVNLPAPPEVEECKGTFHCFLEHVSGFLKICAPSQELWKKFGWYNLTEEAILRKIYDEELFPSLKSVDVQQDTNVRRIGADLQNLLRWEQQGITAIQWEGEISDSIRQHRLWQTEKVRTLHPTQRKAHIGGKDIVENWKMGGLHSFRPTNDVFRLSRSAPAVHRQAFLVRHHHPFRHPYLTKPQMESDYERYFRKMLRMDTVEKTEDVSFPPIVNQ